MDISQIRKQKRAEPQLLPMSVEEDDSLVQVDVTWGIIQPMQLAEGVVTVGELDVYNYQERRLPIIDTRKSNTSHSITISGTNNIPFNELVDRIDELNKAIPSIFFCNGPQCPQTPIGIKALLKADYPADKILYYRGGMHDWITLGLPVQKM